MAKELSVSYSGVRPIYYVLRRKSDSYVYNQGVFEAYDSDNYVDYVLPMISEGGDLYTADMPGVPAGTYQIFYSEQGTSVPLESDYTVSDEIDWSGSLILVNYLLSYTTISETDQYFLARLHNTEWFGATEQTKQIALAEATRIIDRLAFSGYKTSEAQALEFPRSGSAIVPPAIKEATSEIAIALLSGIDPERELRSLRVTSRRFSSVGTTYDARTAPAHILAGVPSATAWGLLLPYLADSRSVIVRRVS